MLGVLQFCPRRGDRTRNLVELEGLVRGALRNGVRLLVLPEMAATGYRFANAAALKSLAEGLEGPTFGVFSRLAREHEGWIVYGFVEAARGRLFNAALAIGPDGQLVAHYRKRLLYADDTAWAEPGDLPYPCFETPWGRATIGICMDMNDPRFSAHVVRSQMDLVCFPTNWIDEGIDTIHRYWSDRLRGFRGTLLAADRWGEEDGVRFWGRSAVIQCGRVLAQAPAVGNTLLTVPAAPVGTGRHSGPSNGSAGTTAGPAGEA